MTMNLPRISVVTPSYNQGAFLEATIRSVLGQNYPNLEYIVIDGGSSDKSVDIIRKYEERLAYWVSEPDRGQAHAINKGFAKATSDIFCWINSDDLLASGALHRVGSHFVEHSRSVWCTGQCEVIEADGRVRRKLAVDVDGSLSDWLVHMKYNRAAILQPSTFWRSSAHHQVGVLRENLHYVFDFEFFYRIRKAMGAPEKLDSVLSQFRLHGESKTVSRKDAFLLEMIAIAREEMADLPAVEKSVVQSWLNEVRGKECFLRQEKALKQGKRLDHLQWRLRGWAHRLAAR